MKLHIFNPEHDIALAYGTESITLPHAIQEFKMNLGYIPALWANDGDCVLVDDVPYALKALAKTHRCHADVVFVTIDDLKAADFSSIDPWGWDLSLRSMLSKSGIIINGKDLCDVVDDRILTDVKHFSNRSHTSALLKLIRAGIEDMTCGESFYVTHPEDIFNLVEKYGQVVVKAPWSSSGRGVKYLSEKEVCPSKLGWIKNIINRQGGLCVEPYHNKVKDFAMEFYSHGDGHISYCGLSLFNTDGVSYTGNVIASESYKMELLSKYVSEEMLTRIRENIIKVFSSYLSGSYQGPFGVDMMIVSGGANGFLLNPCIEINLRRTMGHVANSVRKTNDTSVEFMHIVHDVNYLLRFDSIGKSFVKVI